MKKFISSLMSSLYRGDGLTPMERRRLVRVPCQFPTKIASKGEETQAEIVELSLNGLRLHSPQEFKVEQVLTVASPQTQESSSCIVRWCAPAKEGGFRLGVRFADTPSNARQTWVRQLMKEVTGSSEALFARRQQIRARCNLDASITLTDSQVISGQLEDISLGGVMFVTEEEVEAGQSVLLKLAAHQDFPGLEHRSRVLATRERDGRRRLSLQFGQLNPDQEKQLGDLVVRLLREC